ncbi:outer envelope pore protein 16, chloroplastic [Olea europaea var. sylvestris]|uniref:outer envelope pore protein 16, chloroplastic n=1 Tax=Olea europaea var. sylvestris TaxID=158386 RepID=UPI000C1CD7E6|nr:outer envelope pore protein 16, chloroplastic [Olea europaea var. sylvestris]
MPRSVLSGSINSPKVDLIVDLGNPFLNLTFDGFLKIGTVAAARVAAEEAYYVVKRGSLSHHNFEQTVRNLLCEICSFHRVMFLLREYYKSHYVAPRSKHFCIVLVVRLTNVYFRLIDYSIILQKNAMLGGALTGAVISAASNNGRDKIVTDAIAGGAIATAAEFLNYLT